MFDAVIDISHHNGTDLDFAAIAGGGIAAVVHKATQGTGFFDSTYLAHRPQALDNRLLFGSYHFGTGDDPVAQVGFYLSKVGPRAGELLALDFEKNTTPGGTSMTLDQARVFVSAVHDRVGKWPALYAGGFLKDLLGGRPDPVLANCPLWISHFAAAPVLPPGWTKCALWQWTDGALGQSPVPVAGLGPCDRNRFNGSADELAAFWASVAA